jgi:hypothetical protein
LGDTLLAEFTPDEIETVLAQELGHPVHKDIPVGIVIEKAHWSRPITPQPWCGWRTRTCLSWTLSHGWSSGTYGSHPVQGKRDTVEVNNRHQPVDSNLW